MKNTTPEQFKKKIEKKAPKSRLFINSIKAFITGGIICTFGQMVTNFYLSINLTKEHASCATSITLIFAGVFLTGLDIYRKIAKHAGAGTLVPITGFANAISAPAIEAKTEGYILGVGVKLFSIAGPVLVYGITASVVAGIIIFLFL